MTEVKSASLHSNARSADECKQTEASPALGVAASIMFTLLVTRPQPHTTAPEGRGWRREGRGRDEKWRSEKKIIKGKGGGRRKVEIEFAEKGKEERKGG